MEALDRRRMTYDEYLVFERASETKHEYVSGEVFAMAGGSREHSRLAARLIGQLERTLDLELTTGTLELASIDVSIDIDALYRDPTAA